MPEPGRDDASAGGAGPGRGRRVLILNQPFHPDVVATAQIAKDLADALVARGWSVTAIASRSIYGQKGATLPKRETVDGIEIIRVGSNVFGKTSMLGRLVNFAMYYASALVRGLTMRRNDAVVCLTTPPYVALVGLLLRALRGGRVVYWLMDVYPDVMVAHGMLRDGSLLHRALRRLHLGVLRRVDATIALGRCMKDRLVAQGASGERITVVPVWSVADGAPAALGDADNAYRREWEVGGRLLVMYSGNFGLGHDVQTFLQAAELLRDDDRVRFAFVGGGARKPEVEAFVHDRGLHNCVVAAYQPRERLAELLGAADLHLVTMLDLWWGLVVPSKFFGVAGAGRGAIYVGPAQSEVGRLIDEWGCGLRLDIGDAAGLAARLGELAGDRARLAAMGGAAAEMHERVASREACARTIESLLLGVDAGGRAGSAQALAGAASPGR